MLKKLQSLLFEDEEDDELEEEIEEEEEEEEVVQVKPAPRRRRRAEKPAPEPEPAPAPAPQPVYTAPQPAPKQPAKPVMNRVEVTKTIPVQKVSDSAPKQQTSVFNSPKESVFKRPTAAPRPVFDIPEPAPALVSVSSFGISADQRGGNNRNSQESRGYQNNRSQQQERQSASQRRNTQSSVYEFRPVISPMFGVDEKDMESVQYAPRQIETPAPRQHESSKVLSPIYGAAEKETIPQADNNGADTSAFYPGNANASQSVKQPEDNSFPEFSLDDILSARDEEFSRQTYFNNADPIRTPDIDETVVIDSNRFTPFDQQPLDFNRNNH